MKKKNIAGERFGMLVAIERVEKLGHNWKWQFLCDCGRHCIKLSTQLRGEANKGRLSNCGCQTSRLRSIAGSKAPGNPKHGMYKHPAYRIWNGMKSRCLRPDHHNFKHYGGRGIKIDPVWLESFGAFWADMGSTYEVGLQIDRINTDGDYAPGNCRWVMPKENSRNKRNNRLIQTRWGLISVSEAAERSGLGVPTLFYRINAGWDTEAALTTPVAACGPKPKPIPFQGVPHE